METAPVSCRTLMVSPIRVCAFRGELFNDFEACDQKVVSGDQPDRAAIGHRYFAAFGCDFPFDSK